MSYFQLKGGDSGGERCEGDKEEGEEVTNEPKLIDFSFSRDHSVQWSVLGGFRVLKWGDNGRVTPGAAALQTRPSEKSQPCTIFPGYRELKHSCLYKKIHSYHPASVLCSLTQDMKHLILQI